MRILRWIVALAAAAALPASAQSPAQLQPTRTNTAVLPNSAIPATSATGTTAHDLTKADVDAWLDGFMPYALKAGGIPGAVVVVVKDGQPLTERGFGIRTSKPQTRRPGANALPPRLGVEAVHLDRGHAAGPGGQARPRHRRQQYLDFKIPPKYGKPITLRNLMTHTAGFEETAKYLIEYDKKPVRCAPRRSAGFPTRIYAPGTMPAYSNYGASLAGYIVERVSGEPFNHYVQRHIFQPLGMTHSTFEQPLPASLKPLMSKATIWLGRAEALRSDPARPGRRARRVRRRHGQVHDRPPQQRRPSAQSRRRRSSCTRRRTSRSRRCRMALGFYHENRNGLNIVGHGGDTIFFHSDLHLFLDKNVGLFVSMNSAGKDGAAHPLREQLFEDFTDRYFPAPAQNLPTASTAKAHGAAMSGHYVSSRAGGFNWNAARVAWRDEGRCRQGWHLIASTVTALRRAAQVARGWTLGSGRR